MFLESALNDIDLGKLARLRRSTAASAGPGSTQVMRKPRQASGNVALPEAHPIWP